MERRTFLQTSIAAGVALPLAAFAQNDIIKILIGFPPGGSVDSVARALLPHLERESGRKFLIENKPGAGGRIALELLKTSKADGHSILITPASMQTIYPSSYKSLRYDPLKDFEPFAGFMTAVSCLLVGNQLPVKNYREYIDWVKQAPEERSQFASPAEGSMPHFLGMTMMSEEGLPVQPIPYKGAAPVVSDVMAGHIPAGISPVSDAIEYHKAGKVKILAVGGNHRLASLPDVPSFAELQIKVTGGAEWYAFFARQGTDKALLQSLEQAFFKATASEEVRKLFDPKGWVLQKKTGPEVTATIAQEIPEWKATLSRLKWVAQ